MELHYDNTLPIERDPVRTPTRAPTLEPMREPMRAPMREPVPTRVGTAWEQQWPARGSIFDPAYDRANAALRRWIDGMEAALSERRMR